MRSSAVKKIYCWLFLLLFVLGGCVGNNNDTKVTNHFAIVLVKGVKTGDAIKFKIEELPLEAEPVITDKDLISYKWKDHELELRQEFDLNKFSGKVPVHGLPFVVIADDKRVYLGAFWTPISSISSSVPVIEIPINLPQNTLSIEAGYPGKINNQADPRSNQLIHDALKSVGKIK